MQTGLKSGQRKPARIMMLKNSPQRLLDAARASVDRMPMLRAIFGRMASECSDALQELSPCPALFSVDSLVSERISEALADYDRTIVVGVFEAQVWDSRLYIGLEHSLIFALAEALYGGDGSEPPVIEKPQLSNVELRLTEEVFGLLGKTLQTSFASVSEAAFRLDRIETSVDSIATSRMGFGARINMKVRILGRDSRMFIMIPQNALNAIRQGLVRDLGAEAPISDPRWAKQIESEIGDTEIEVRGVIEEHQFTLADIASLEIGQVLPLQTMAKTRVKLEVNSEPLCWCDLGQADGFYMVRVDEFVASRREFADCITPR